MGDPSAEPSKASRTMTSMAGTVTNIKNKYGFSPGYLISFPGILRIFNIVIGSVCFGLWLKGYEHEFLGERINLNTGDTAEGYGNGWKREPLNQFVLSSIIIALFSSILLLLSLVFVRSASLDWNRFNKFIHLILAVFSLITAICSIFGVWFFNENCCHVAMIWEGAGFNFEIATGEGYYVRHCACYLTRYQGSEQFGGHVVKDTVPWDGNKGGQEYLIQGVQRFTFAAHDVNPHVAVVFLLFLNSVVYFLGFIFSKVKAPVGESGGSQS